MSLPVVSQISTVPLMVLSTSGEFVLLAGTIFVNQLTHQTIVRHIMINADACGALSSLERTAVFCRTLPLVFSTQPSHAFPGCRHSSLLSGFFWCYPPHRKKRSITVSFVQETPGGYICGVDVVNFKTPSTHRIVVRLDTDTGSWQL